MNPAGSSVPWNLFLPELGLGTVILFYFVSGLLKKAGKEQTSLQWLISALVILVVPLLMASWPMTGNAFSNAFKTDALAVFLKSLLLLSGLAALFMVQESRDELKRRQYDFSVLLLFAVLGAFFLISSNDLISLFIAIEWMTISLYSLTSFTTGRLSLESGVKYLVVGIFSSAVMLFGISLIYGGTAAVQFDALKLALTDSGHLKLARYGFFLLLAGIGFKISAFPFQFWVPDVYEGAPTPVTAFLSVGSKTAGFAALFKVFQLIVPAHAIDWKTFISVIGLLTLLYGNLGALGQTNMKRLFAYSSIGHAGYLLIGTACQSAAGFEASLFYLAAYALSNLTAFLVIYTVEQHDSSGLISSYRSLNKRSPLLAGSLFIALLSLGGVPPLTGFFAKFLILKAAVNEQLLWLAVIGAVTVPISLFYYLSIVREMFFGGEAVVADGSEAEPHKIEASVSVRFVLIGLSAALIMLGIFQAPLFYAAEHAAGFLF